MKNVMVFGFFDGLTEDHKAFLASARLCGNHLTAVVLQDHIAGDLYQALPRNNFLTRFEDLKETRHADRVLIGDSRFGVVGPIKKHSPDVVVFGAKQHALRHNFQTNLHQFKKQPAVKTVNLREPHI